MQHVQAGPPRDGDASIGGRFQVTTVHADATHARLRAAGQLDRSTVDELTAVLKTLLGWGRRRVQLDLTAVKVVDRGCLPALVRVHEMFLAEHGLLVLTSLSPDLAALLRQDRRGRALFIIEPPGGRPADDRPEERAANQATFTVGSQR